MKGSPEEGGIICDEHKFSGPPYKLLALWYGLVDLENAQVVAGDTLRADTESQHEVVEE